MSDGDEILNVQDLSSGYGRSQVLFGVSLSSPRTGAVAMLGRNGAGKTTLLKTLIGEIKPMDGLIGFDHIETQNENTEKRVRRGMGYVPQEQAVFTTLTVRENLALGAISQKDKSGIDMVLDFFPKLGERLEQQAGTLSGGERKMLAIGRALLSKPKLLLLDEPSLGLSPLVVDEIFKIIKKINEEGTAILLVEQNAQRAFSVADFGYIIENGRIVLSDTVQNLIEQEDVKEFYLGISRDISIKGYKRYKRKKRWR